MIHVLSFLMYLDTKDGKIVKKNMALLRIVWWRNKRADFHLPVLDLNKQHENPILFHYKMLKETITMIVSLWVT